MKALPIAALIALLLASGATAAFGQQEQGSSGQGGDGRRVGLTDADLLYQMVATRTATPPRIDGRPDEAQWDRAQVVTDFLQSMPDEGQPASERTEVRVLFDDEAIYIAAFCFDRQPDQIVASVMRRDEPHDNNDSFTVTLDTYHDHRNGFYFETNAMGARFDAQIVSEGGTSMIQRRSGDNFNRDWDVVWEAAGQITDEGWFAEMKIPFWALRFEPEQLSSWGINFRRTIRRRSEQSYWAPVGRQFDATRVSLSGMMTGLEGIGRSRNVQLLPFATGSMLQTKPIATPLTTDAVDEREYDGDLGLDAKWGITPNMTLDLTFNTDFSQVEADDQQINLTRFSLFFPEKREFFLENAGLFEFGSGAGIPRGGRVAVVGFHSRRIGISEGNNQIVPLWGGGRLTGKVGRWSVGALSMQSRSTDTLPTENYTVARVTRDVADRSRVGVLFTNRQSSGDVYNRQLGFDGRWAINAQTTVDAWWMTTETPEIEGSKWAGQASFDWGTPLWQVQSSVLQVGDAFNPELGFVNRTDIRQYNNSVHWTPYPEADWVRNLAPHGSFIFTTDLSNRLMSRFLHFDYDMFLKRGDKLSIAYNSIYEQLDFPFEIVPGVLIPPGTYEWGETNFELESDRSRVAFGKFTYTQGGFWSGDRKNYEVGGGMRAGARFDIEIEWERNDVVLPQGAFVTDLVRTRFGLDFTTLLSLRGLVQYNSETDQVLTNLRVRYIYRPGSDLYVVYNETRLSERSDLIDRAIIVKFVYFVRF